jgi:hypothetical protein
MPQHYLNLAFLLLSQVLAEVQPKACDTTKLNAAEPTHYLLPYSTNFCPPSQSVTPFPLKHAL